MTRKNKVQRKADAAQKTLESVEAAHDAPPPPLLSVHLPYGMLNRTEAVAVRARLGEDGITVESGAAGDGPHVYVTAGNAGREHSDFMGLPLSERRLWIHVEDAAAITTERVFGAWLRATEPRSYDVPSPPPPASPTATPLVSIFTTSFRSNDKIRRPLESLYAQTHENWEWVIVDDSRDGGLTYARDLEPLAAADPRVRIFRQRGDGTGYIGTAKRCAASLCTGAILVEIDHDDEIAPDCLAGLVAAFAAHPDCGFAFAESGEVHEGTLEPITYGRGFGFGYGMEWRQHVPWGATGRSGAPPWTSVVRAANLNAHTIQHLVGLPNHPRAWRAECYHAIGGHRVGLSVADDFDLLLRTFLRTRFVRVPRMAYLQYRNAPTNGGNQTFLRNHTIQVACQNLRAVFWPRIVERFASLGMACVEAAASAGTLGSMDAGSVLECPRDSMAWVDAGRTHALLGRTHVIILSDSGNTGSEAADEAGNIQAIYEAVAAGNSNAWARTEVLVAGRGVAAGDTFAGGARAMDAVQKASIASPAGAVRWQVFPVDCPVSEMERWAGAVCTFRDAEGGPATAVTREPMTLCP